MPRSRKKYLRTLHNMSIALTSAILVMKQEEQFRKQKAPRLWSREWLKKRDEGVGKGLLAMWQNELRFQDLAMSENFTRLPAVLFQSLLDMITPFIIKQDTNMRQSISPAKRLAVTLRFLATGESYRSLMISTRISEVTLSLLIPEVLKAIYDCLKADFLRCPADSASWEQIAKRFNDCWQFPNCIGAIDGKHIYFRAPQSAGSYYYNYKGTHSIVLLAVVDADYKFIYVNVGVNGRISDGGVFRESSFCKALQTGRLNLPQEKCLPGMVPPVPYVVVADDAFPLSKNLMKPYPSRRLSYEQRIFNYRLSRARRVVENAFGILSNRFRLFLQIINLAPHKVELAILAACCLHNYLIKQGITTFDEEIEGRFVNIGLQGGNRTQGEAMEIRQIFTEYFNSVGAVPWQDNYV